MEGWLTHGELEGEAAEGPDVNLSRITDALGDLGRNPRWRAPLSLSILLLLGEEHAKSHIGDLNVAIWTTQDIVRLYISVKDILRVHLLEAKRDLEQTPLAEVFREFAVAGKYDFCQITALHYLQEDPETVLEVVYFFALD